MLSNDTSVMRDFVVLLWSVWPDEDPDDFNAVEQEVEVFSGPAYSQYVMFEGDPADDPSCTVLRFGDARWEYYMQQHSDHARVYRPRFGVYDHSDDIVDVEDQAIPAPLLDSPRGRIVPPSPLLPEADPRQPRLDAGVRATLTRSLTGDNEGYESEGFPESATRGDARLTHAVRLLLLPVIIVYGIVDALRNKRWYYHTLVRDQSVDCDARKALNRIVPDWTTIAPTFGSVPGWVLSLVCREWGSRLLVPFAVRFGRMSLFLTENMDEAPATVGVRRHSKRIWFLSIPRGLRADLGFHIEPSLLGTPALYTLLFSLVNMQGSGVAAFGYATGITNVATDFYAQTRAYIVDTTTELFFSFVSTIAPYVVTVLLTLISLKMYSILRAAPPPQKDKEEEARFRTKKCLFALSILHSQEENRKELFNRLNGLPPAPKKGYLWQNAFPDGVSIRWNPGISDNAKVRMSANATIDSEDLPYFVEILGEGYEPWKVDLTTVETDTKLGKYGAIQTEGRGKKPLMLRGRIDAIRGQQASAHVGQDGVRIIRVSGDATIKMPRGRDLDEDNDIYLKLDALRDFDHADTLEAKRAIAYRFIQDWGAGEYLNQPDYDDLRGFLEEDDARAAKEESEMARVLRNDELRSAHYNEELRGYETLNPSPRRNKRGHDYESQAVAPETKPRKFSTVVVSSGELSRPSYTTRKYQIVSQMPTEDRQALRIPNAVKKANREARKRAAEEAENARVQVIDAANCEPASSSEDEESVQVESKTAPVYDREKHSPLGLRVRGVRLAETDEKAIMLAQKLEESRNVQREALLSNPTTVVPKAVLEHVRDITFETENGGKMTTNMTRMCIQENIEVWALPNHSLEGATNDLKEKTADIGKLVGLKRFPDDDLAFLTFQTGKAHASVRYIDANTVQKGNKVTAVYSSRGNHVVSTGEITEVAPRLIHANYGTEYNQNSGDGKGTSGCAITRQSERGAHRIIGLHVGHYGGVSNVFLPGAVLNAALNQVLKDFPKGRPPGGRQDVPMTQPPIKSNTSTNPPAGTASQEQKSTASQEGRKSSRKRNASPAPTRSSQTLTLDTFVKQ